MSLSPYVSVGLVAFAGLAQSATVLADGHTCENFSVAYPTAADIPKIMWFDAFTYEVNESIAYDMWWDSGANPNHDVTTAYVSSGAITIPKDTHFDSNGLIDRCYLDSYHKPEDDVLDNAGHPTYKPEDFKVCTPWKERSCCKPAVQESVDILKNWYGVEWAWDACGTISPACKKFYKEENCFYECSPNAGLFRKYRTANSSHHTVGGGTMYDPNDADHNKWSIYKMPIKASYWNAWHEACKNDMISIDYTEPTLPSGATAHGAAALAVAVVLASTLSI